MSLSDWFPGKRPKNNPSAPVWTGGTCTLQTKVITSNSLEDVERKANAFASDKMVASIDIRKDKGGGSLDSFEKSSGVKKDVWYAQVNFWVELR